MLVKVFGAAMQGIDALTVTIEVNCSQGIHFYMVGLADTAVRESHERIRSALQHNGYKFPHRQLIINLAPADRPTICHWPSAYWQPQKRSRPTN